MDMRGGGSIFFSYVYLIHTISFFFHFSGQSQTQTPWLPRFPSAAKRSYPNTSRWRNHAEASVRMLGGSILNQFHQPSAPPPNVNEGSEKKSRKQEFLGWVRRCRGIEEFKQIHGQYAKLDLHRKEEYAGALLRACALSDWGSVRYAHKLFDGIPDPNSFEFNTLIRGYVKEATNLDGAIWLYIRMQETGVIPDKFTFPFVIKACSGIREGMQVHGHVFKFGFWEDAFVRSSLIGMYGSCGDIESSLVAFEQTGNLKDVALWSSIVAAHVRSGMWGDCLKLFGRMRAEGWRADESTMVSVITSCANIGALELGRCSHGALLRNAKELNVIMQTSLLDMYVKCGQLGSGLKVFHGMRRRNLWSYSAAISGLAMHGEGEEALRVFEDMIREGLEPDEAVWVGLLTACSNAGLVEEGLRVFDGMMTSEELTIRHYGCMVDLMCRAGKLEQAFEFVGDMPMEPDASIWRSLLGACRARREFELAETAGRNLLRLDARKGGDYVLVSNIYSMANRWEEAARIRTKMIDEGFVQSPGYTRVELNGELHTFVSQDRSHVQSDEIYEMLHQMEWQLRFEGYSPDTSHVLLCNVGEEEKRRALAAHSQKLAIAYALLSTNEGTAIRLVRNLRMCGDCHTYTKMISKIFHRQIIVRECHRFHHFREGVCSCNERW